MGYTPRVHVRLGLGSVGLGVWVVRERGGVLCAVLFCFLFTYWHLSPDWDGLVFFGLDLFGALVDAGETKHIGEL